MLGYAIVCSAVFAVLQVVGEMTIAFPTSGNFIDYADRFVDPALAFAAGFAEWLGNELVLHECEGGTWLTPLTQDGQQSLHPRPSCSIRLSITGQRGRFLRRHCVPFALCRK